MRASLHLATVLSLLVLGCGSALAAGGDFNTTDLAAAAPYTYSHKTGGGAYNDGTNGDTKDVTEQLEGGQFACGDVVTFLTKIEVSATPVHSPQTAEFDFSFLADSTGQTGAALAEVVGVRINYGQVENGDNGTGVNPGAGFFGTDSGIRDDKGSTATLVSSGLDGPLFTAGSNLLATVRVDDIEAGEAVVLRIDTRIACQPGTSPTGNLQGALTAGRVVSPVSDTINTGNQTIPFLKVGELFGAGEPMLQIEKTVTTADGACTDSVEQMTVTAGSTVKYCYKVSNPGTYPLYDVVVKDDNGTAGNASDDFIVSLTGLVNSDGESVFNDLAAGATATGYALVPLTTVGNVVNIAAASGNNNLSGGNAQTLTASDQATVTVSEAANVPPVAVDDSATTDEDTTVTINVAGNDTDSDGNLALDSVEVTSEPTHGTLLIHENGTVTYTPNPNYSGPDSFGYKICDALGLCDTAIVAITVSPLNDPPTAIQDSASTAEDTSVTLDVTANDSDVDGNPLIASVVTSPSNGTVIQNPEGTFTYTPNPNFNGTDTFTYEVCDTNGACSQSTVTIAVATGNDPPVAEDDQATTNEGVPVTIPVLGNDSDVDGNLVGSSVTVTSAPANGTVTKNDDGNFTYTPNAGFSGTDTFTYQVCDIENLCDTATVTVTVVAVKPVANEDQATTPEDGTLVIDAAANDTDPDGNLDASTAEVVSGPAHGRLVDNNDGTFTYIPDLNYHGSDSFTYRICDRDGNCDTATVAITVTPVNDAPEAVNDSATTPEDTPVTVYETANVSDVDNNLDWSTATVISPPAHGSVVVNGDGVFTYTPQADYHGPDSFTYQVCDTDELCTSATVVLNVTPVNDPPTAGNDTYTTKEDTPLTVDASGVLGNDSDLDGDVLTVSVLTGPKYGTLAQSTDGSFTYTPNENYYGNDSYTYKACDASGACAEATVTLIVGSDNDAPVTADDTYSTAEDASLTISAAGVLGNDSDPDGDALTASVVSGPLNGTLTLNADGSFTYAPAANYNGPDSFTYNACDTSNVCKSATVALDVTPVNDPPKAVNDAYSTLQDTPLAVAAIAGVLGNDSDIDGDTLTVNRFDNFSRYGGSVTVSGDGSLVYTPAPGFAGYDTFTYTVSDGNGGTATATVTITVNARNNRSISVDLQDFTLSDRSLSGIFLITNQSGDYDVQIVNAAVEVEYQVPGSKWVPVTVDAGSCTFNPSPTFLVVDQQLVQFSNCMLAADIPAGATVRVTAKAQIFGRINGKGKLETDGWFLSRLSK